MKQLLPISFFLFCVISSIARQSQTTTIPGNTIEGIIKDRQSKLAIPFVSVNIKDVSSKLIVTGVTDEKGVFKLEGVPQGDVSIEFTFMGYQKITKTMQVAGGQKPIDLGILFMEADVTLLKEVEVTTDRPGVSLKLDKKVFEVGKDLLLQAGSATEMLNGLPAVSVSPSGTISLRGNSNVLILVNGRRTGLTQANALDQFPADQVERVEIITNPSSRYDASGSAGIINIILKKNKKSGFNGQLRMVGGVPNETRITPSINYKADKLSLFSTFGIRKADYDGLYTTQQSTSNNGTMAFLNQRQDEDRHDDGKMLYFGGDYQIDSLNSVTAAFYKNATNDHDRTVLNYDYSGQVNERDSSLMRSGESWEKRDYNQLEFNYTRNFKHPGKKYTIDMQYDFWNSDKDWTLDTKRLFPTIESFPVIRTSSIGSSKDFMLQTDLVQPLDSISSFEFGLKAENRNITSAFKAEQQDGANWETFDNIDNQLDYNELIGSAYTQFANKIGKLSYQMGLRTEITRIRISDRLDTYHSRKNYARLFPSLNMNYELGSGATLQFSYSKRINRPSLNLLYPFNELTDFNARYIGNPDLNPSYADVFELGFLKNWNGFTFNPSLYAQNNSGFILDYVSRNSDGIFITSPINIATESRQGIELSTMYSAVKWLQLNIELNAYGFKQKGQYKDQDFDYSGQILTTRVNAQLKFQHNFTLQCRYNFTGAQSTAQSRTSAIHAIDVGTGKNLFKDKVSLLFDISNLFNLRKYATTTTGNNYVLEQINNPNAARYRLTFVYKLNLKDNQSVRQAKSGNRN